MLVYFFFPEPGQSHPAAGIATEDAWPVLKQVCSVYSTDSRIMERTCRTLRFVIRCIGTQSHVIAEELVMRLVSLYNLHPHSCFLYLVSANQYHSGNYWNFLLLFLSGQEPSALTASYSYKISYTIR